MKKGFVCVCWRGWVSIGESGMAGEEGEECLRVEVGDSCVVAFWQGNKFVACAFDDGEGDKGSRHCLHDAR